VPIREPSEPPEAGSDGFSSAIESICLFCFVSLSRSHARAASAWCSLLVRGSRGDRGEWIWRREVDAEATSRMARLRKRGE